MTRFEQNIRRNGKRTEVHSQQATGTSDFGETETEYSLSHEVWCLRTYPNRNEVRSSPQGQYSQDNPVFLLPADADVSTSDRLKYDGQMYGLRGITTYDTHTAVFGKPVQ